MIENVPLTVLLGYVQEYPCDCSNKDTKICWIVRYPGFAPVSYPTKGEAVAELNNLRKDYPNG